MLQDKMAVEQDRFHFGKKRIIAIDVRPARLHHADFWIGEMVDRAQQEVLWWHEVRVKDGNELACCGFHSLRQRARLVALSVCTMVIRDRKPTGSISVDLAAGYRASFVGGVIEKLDVEFPKRVIQSADGIQQALDHKPFIKNRELDRNPRELRELATRLDRVVLLVLVIEIDQYVAMYAIRSEQDEHHEIRNQQRQIEGVGVIKALESFIEEMRTEVLAESVRAE